jgi:hypothetical protein
MHKHPHRTAASNHDSSDAKTGWPNTTFRRGKVRWKYSSWALQTLLLQGLRIWIFQPGHQADYLKSIRYI